MPSSSPVHSGTREARSHVESIPAPVHQARQSLSCERVVQGTSEKGLSHGAARAGGGVRRVACSPGMARGSGDGRRGEDEGVAGVEKVFRARCSKLRQMVAAVKEVGYSMCVCMLYACIVCVCVYVCVYVYVWIHMYISPCSC